MAKTILLIILSYIIYFIFLPPLQVNDESQHIKNLVAVSKGSYPYLPRNDRGRELPEIKKIFDQINFVDKPNQLPTFKSLYLLEEKKGDYNIKNVPSYEAHYPPIYYIFGAVFFYISKISRYLLVQYYIMRLASALFFFGTVLITARILSFFIKNEKTASSVLLFFSINPLVLKMGIGINPDIAVTFFSLLFLNLMLREKRVKSNILFSAVSALAMMTKISGLFTNLAYSIYCLVIGGFKKKVILKILTFQIFFWGLVLPWLAFVFSRYHNAFPEPFATSCGRVPAARSFIQIFFTIVFSFRHTFMHYAGFMGPAWPHPFNWFFTIYVILFLILMFVGIYSVARVRNNIWKAMFSYSGSLILLLAVLSTQQRVALLDCDLQGRYMLPIFLPLCLFVYLGLKVLVKNEDISAFMIRGFAIFHYLFILITVVLLRYYV